MKLCIFTRNLWRLLLFTMYCGIIYKVKSEVFSSMVDLQSLRNTEDEFQFLIDWYLKSEENRLLQIIEESILFQDTILDAKTEDILNNSIDIFHLIRRMNFNTSSLFKLMQSTTLEKAMLELSFKLPDNDDLEGVILALDRLAVTYNLSISKLTNGDLSYGIDSTTEFSAKDCNLIGNVLYNSKMYFRARFWQEEAVNRWNREKHKSIKEESILTYLGYIVYLTLNDNIYAQVSDGLKKMGKNKRSIDIFKTAFDYMKNHFESNKLIVQDHSFLHHKQFNDTMTEHNRLCRNEILLDPSEQSKLLCYYSANMSPILLLQPIKVEDAYLEPWVAIFHDVISDNEMDIAKQLSTPKLRRAEIDTGEVVDYRISKSAWIPDSAHPYIESLSRRLQEITGLDFTKAAENLQVVNYGIGGHYETHFDYVETLSVGETTDLHPKGDRLATVLLYMSDVKAGGSTVFPRLKIAVQPIKGSAVFWFNLLKSCEQDPRTEHAGCPVLAGSKWVSNKWIKQHHHEFTKRCGLSKQDSHKKTNLVQAK